jgi:AcrR family transcriptional regulator
VKQGYSKTTTREIAQACGLKHGSLYHYIGAKSDILHLILDKQPELKQSLETLIKQLEGLGYREILEKVILEHLRNNEEFRDLVRFVQRESPSFPPLDRRRLLQEESSAIHLIEKVIIEGVEAGEFHTDDPYWVALTIHELGRLWAIRRQVIGEGYTFEGYLSKVSETAFRLLEIDTG